MKTTNFIQVAFYFICLFIISLTSCTNSSSTNDEDAYSPIEIPLEKGPYQINGASPWYATLPLGSNQQILKFGMDTGNNANWVTSVQCTTQACTQPGRTRFDFNQSTSFQWVNQSIDTLKFGPWGNMAVNTGMDYFSFNIRGGAIPANILLSVWYDYEQFEELDWDGGIGFPSQKPDPRTTWLLEQMVNGGLVDPNDVCVSFYNDPGNGAGHIKIGGIDYDLIDETSWLRFPFVPFTGYDQGLEYLWSTPLEAWTVNGVEMGNDTTFVFDTGASDFKGDTIATNAATAAIIDYFETHNSYPIMELVMGMDGNGNPGQLALTSDQYIQYVQKGEKQGQEVIAIDTLNIDGMLLVGSILFEDLYPVFWYEASGSPGDYQLTPIEVWLFNKKNGPKIIQNYVAEEEN